ncbi:hypothetical protein [Helicobacter pylori]|uniref:hypothetical protein n=1 Tax=Helicobacter pylori TaxID=210 RepID=UPI001C62EC63|nr:hypothetical protein [Helicobacter pylori]
MRNYHSLRRLFYFDCKNTQRHQFDYQYSIKNFYRLYKMRWNIVKCPIAKDALGFLD